MRLDKYISNGGYKTRKEVKKLINQGRVSVNSKVILKADYKVDIHNDEVICNHEKIIYKKFYYFMINKPQGVLSATKDEVSNSETIIDLLDDRLQKIGLFPVGRLDKDTEGLLILTNDGNFAHKTLSPKNNVRKIYFAVVSGIKGMNGAVTEEDVAAFKDGVTINGDYKCKPADLHILKIDTEKNLSETEVTVTEGKFHQVKKMFESVNKNVIYLKRIMFANIALDEKLSLGEYRELNSKEMKILDKYID